MVDFHSGLKAEAQKDTMSNAIQVASSIAAFKFKKLKNRSLRFKFQVKFTDFFHEINSTH